MKVGTVVYNSKMHIDRRDEMNDTDVYTWETVWNPYTWQYDLVRIVCVG